MLATPLQKGCFKLWQRQMAEALNDSGQTLRNAIESGNLRLDVPWNEHMVQELFTDNYMMVMHSDKESISELTTIELNDLHEAVNGVLLQVFSISIPFPSEEELKYRTKK